MWECWVSVDEHTQTERRGSDGLSDLRSHKAQTDRRNTDGQTDRRINNIQTDLIEKRKHSKQDGNDITADNQNTKKETRLRRLTLDGDDAALNGIVESIYVICTESSSSPRCSDHPIDSPHVTANGSQVSRGCSTERSRNQTTERKKKKRICCNIM